MNSAARWGLVATVQAPVPQIVQFCAYHLRAGAAHLFIYLDDPDCELPDHPRITVTHCDKAHWSALDGRPKRHQVRQGKNANHAYATATGLDWLIHMDVDEFLIGADPVATALAALPHETLCARVRPVEALCGVPGLFKRAVRKGHAYNDTMARLYPKWGDKVRGGFLSHTQGKLFVRTGQPGLQLRIHNVFRGTGENPGLATLDTIDLAHLHAPSWAAFRAAFHTRMERGSYRADLAPNRPRAMGGVTLHELFSAVYSEGGMDGIRSIFNELCVARPELTEALEQRGLLVRADLQLENAVRAEWPSMI